MEINSKKKYLPECEKRVYEKQTADGLLYECVNSNCDVYELKG